MRGTSSAAENVGDAGMEPGVRITRSVGVYPATPLVENLLVREKEDGITNVRP